RACWSRQGYWWRKIRTMSDIRCSDGPDTRRGRLIPMFSPVQRILAICFAVCLITACTYPDQPTAPTAAGAGGAEWVALFDGESLDGWRASELPGTFRVEGGNIIVHGARSHLYYTGPVADHD